jgi:hypothetical protein
MPFDVNLEPGEDLVLKELYQPTRKTQPFAFAVSTRALFLPAKRMFAVSDPWYFRRVPLPEVRNVAIRRLRSAGVWALAGVMASVGLVTTYWMLYGRATKVSGYPIAVAVVGLVLPLLARGRYALTVGLTRGSFTWRPPILIGGSGKANGVALQERILQACGSVGVHIRDERVSGRGHG